MATTDVCFVARDAKMFKEPTWKSRRPGRTAADAHKETPATQVDIFCHERAGLIERMARLAGSTTWRDPSILPTGQASEPWNDWLNSACVWLHDHRADATDVTGDILHGLAVMWMPEDVEDRVVNIFAAALADRYGVFGHLRSAAPGRVDAIARAIARMCTYGVEHPWPRRATRAQIGCAEAFGVSMYWAQADAGVRRAREALEGM